MKQITITMINMYKIEKMDFMGYTFNKIDELNYHHMIIPKRLNGKETVRNGAILNEFSSHPYLHLIEYKDKELFDLITLELIKENIKGKIDLDIIKKIWDYLNYFEKEHCNDVSKKGKILIKEPYTRRMIK